MNRQEWEAAQDARRMTSRPRLFTSGSPPRSVGIYLDTRYDSAPVFVMAGRIWNWCRCVCD